MVEKLFVVDFFGLFERDFLLLDIESSDLEFLLGEDDLFDVFFVDSEDLDEVFENIG